MKNNSKYTKEELLQAFDYVEEQNLWVPLTFILGKVVVDEAEFFLSDYSSDDINAFYKVAIGLNLNIVNIVNFQIDNEQRNTKYKEGFGQLFNSVRKKSRVSFTDDTVTFDLSTNPELQKWLDEIKKTDSSEDSH
jgi:hypothetical protein